MQNLRIRTATPKDAAPILEIYTPAVELTPASFELTPPSVPEFAERIRSYSDTHEWLIAQDDGNILGYTYATPHRPREAYRFSVETSVYVSEHARQRGVGRKLYSELFNRLSGKDFHNAFAGITLPNDASLNLHKAVGFTSIGVFREVGYKLGKWHSVSWWQRSI